MIAINSALGVLVFLVGFALCTSIVLIMKTTLLFNRCLAILAYAHYWLKEARHTQQTEVTAHEGTD